MKNKKIVTIIATLGLLTFMGSSANAAKFYDTLGTRYESAVERLQELDIVSGVSNNIFNAERTVTRAEFAKMIVEASLNDDEINALLTDRNTVNFSDVSNKAWYYDYVVVATNYGYIKGYKDNTFKPDKEVTYEEVAKMISLALGHSYLTEDDDRGWAAQYMDKMYSLGILKGVEYSSQKDNATRGNVAIMIWNMLTNEVWKKIELTDSTGFTYSSTGVTLFEKNIKGYEYRNNVVISGFKEVDGRLAVVINNATYKLIDDTNITFSMIGGPVDMLLKRMRYPDDVYTYEVAVISSSEVGSTVKAGLIKDLKDDGISTTGINNTRITSGADFAYIVQAEGFEDRMVSLKSDNTRYVVDSIKINKKEEKAEKDLDDPEDIINEANGEYEYVENYSSVEKTITINEDDEISDGAVLFKNNKWVEWDTVKKGDIITEISKDKYYFLSDETLTTTIDDYKVDSSSIEFYTTDGTIYCYQDSKCTELYSTKEISIKSLGASKLEALVGKRVEFELDFTGRAVNMRILDNLAQNDKEELKELENLGIAFFSESYNTGDESARVKLIVGTKAKTYRATAKSIDADFGDLVLVSFDGKNNITEFKKLSGNSTKINDKFTFKSITYKNLLSEDIEENVPIYHAKYEYDFGEYEKIVDFKVTQIDIDELEDFDKDNINYYVLYDENSEARMIVLQDYSEEKDVFYGKVEEIKVEKDKTNEKDKDDSKENKENENGNKRIVISILGNKKKEFLLTEGRECEVGDIVSFKMVENETVQILEKYSPSTLGYYKDIIVETLSSSSKKPIITSNGTINLSEGTLIADDEEYDMNDYILILINVSKDNDAWAIKKANVYELSELKLAVNDRIAINEIEDTMIIYRGYSD